VTPVRHRLLPAAALAATVGALATGCGKGEEADLVKGKTLFVQKCGSCHVLGRANTQGQIGPSLDKAFQAARRDGLGENTIEGVTYEQILSPRRNSKMPARLVQGGDARDVAAYVAEAAAVPGQDEGELAQAGRPKQSKRTVRAQGGRLQIDADPSGALAFAAAKAVAEAGGLELVMENPSPIQHNIAVKGSGLDEKGPVVGNGGTSSVRADLKPGTYTFYCSVPGHEAGGMKGTLTVR
jgi:mono/diheme cytochrome c family protein